MNYKEVYKLSLDFSDGKKDYWQHPYVVILDRNNEIEDYALMLKSKTYSPDKHTFYIDNGMSFGPVMLERDSVFNLDEIYEMPISEIKDVFFNMNEEDFFDLSIGLYYSYEDGHILDNNKTIFEKHKSDLIRHLNKHKLI